MRMDSYHSWLSELFRNQQQEKSIPRRFLYDTRVTSCLPFDIILRFIFQAGLTDFFQWCNIYVHAVFVYTKGFTARSLEINR